MESPCDVPRIVDPVGGDPERLTATDTDDRSPAFSPDGRYLVFASGRAGGGFDCFVAEWTDRPLNRP